MFLSLKISTFFCKKKYFFLQKEVLFFGKKKYFFLAKKSTSRHVISEEVAQINPAMMRRAMLDMKAKTVKCNPAVGGEQPVILPQRPPDPATELCSSFYARGRLPHESKDSSIRT